MSQSNGPYKKATAQDLREAVKGFVEEAVADLRGDISDLKAASKQADLNIGAAHRQILNLQKDGRASEQRLETLGASLRQSIQALRDLHGKMADDHAKLVDTVASQARQVQDLKGVVGDGEQHIAHAVRRMRDIEVILVKSRQQAINTLSKSIADAISRHLVDG